MGHVFLLNEKIMQINYNGNTKFLEVQQQQQKNAGLV